jgi:hypothetical protein
MYPHAAQAWSSTILAWLRATNQRSVTAISPSTQTIVMTAINARPFHAPASGDILPAQE